jgi:hypothetical protein
MMCLPCRQVDCVWNVMAHAQEPDYFFRLKGQVHSNRRGRQFSRLLAAEVCASAVAMLDTPCSEGVWRVLATHSIRQFPLHFPSLRHLVPSHFNWSRQNVSQKYFPALPGAVFFVASCHAWANPCHSQSSGAGFKGTKKFPTTLRDERKGVTFPCLLTLRL